MLGSRLRAVVVMSALVGAGALPACQTAQAVSRRGELDVALSRHHVDLRWGRVPAAARYVHPDLQSAFVEDWERRAKTIEITELEVLEVYEEPGGQAADVRVKIAWIEKSTQSFREAVLAERWEEVDGAWIVTRPADLSAQGD